jgi:hypothetical protein
MNEPNVPTEPSAHVARWIETYGVWHEITELSLDKIDERSSLRNQARLKPLDPDVVSTYAAAMEAGAVFPPLVGWDGSSGVVLCDGNHRYAAAKAVGAPGVLVYIVQTDDDSIKQMMVAAANPILNGYGADDADKIRHGVALVGQGLSIKAAARQLSLTFNTLRRHVIHDNVCAAARRFGLERIAIKTPLMYTEILGSVVDEYDSTTLRLLLASASLGVRKDDYRALVRSLQDLDDDTRAEAVMDFNDRHRKAINKPTGRDSLASASWKPFKMHTVALLNMRPADVVASIPGDKRDDLQRLADDLRGFASSIERGLRT